MNPFLRWPLLATCLLLTVPASAQEPTLSLDDAAALAIAHQPQLETFTAEARAARQRAVAAGQLPDPSLSLGVTDLTLEGRDRFTFEKESDTQISAGVRQAFPRAAKRTLRHDRAEREAESFEAERSATERQIAQETALAWLEAWKAEESLRLTRSTLTEAERQVQAMTIALSANRASQAEVLAAKVETESLRDQADGFAQASRHARNMLARWVGEVAFKPLSADLPAEPEPDALALIAALTTHPHFLAEAKKVDIAIADVGLAQQDYRSDWAVTLGYSHRPAFSDYAQLQVEIGLPIFTANRQAPQLASAQAMQAAQEARLADALREHAAEIRLNADDWQQLQTRLARFKTRLLPQAKSRIEAALIGYGSGTAPLKEVLDARRAALELAMQQLTLRTDSAMHSIKLRYFAP